MLYLGIDPGTSSGGFAYLNGKKVNLLKMPQSEFDILDFFSFFDPGDTVAYLEKVQGYAGGRNNGSQMFKFGNNYGHLQMALTAAKIPFEEVVPQKWQRGLSIPKRKKTETDTQWKRRLKRKAQTLFPAVANNITNNTADALLIAEFCRRSKHA